MNDDKDVLLLFLAEAKEHLSTAEADILQLEQTKEAPDVETINRLFRAMHTIKGGASFFNMDNVTKLAHALENKMGMVRDGKLLINQEISDILLKCVDKLGSLLENPTDETVVQINDELSMLDTVREKGKESVPSGIVGPEEPRRPLFDLQKLYPAIENSQENYLCFCTLDFAAEQRKQGKPPSYWLKELTSIGNLIETRYEDNPGSDPDKFEGKTLRFSFLLSTVLDDSSIISEGMHLSPLFIEIVNRKEFLLKLPEPPPVQSPTEPVTPAIQIEEKKDKTRVPSLPAKEKAGDRTLRIPLSLLDRLMNLTTELVLVRNKNQQAVALGDLNQITSISQNLSLVTSEIQESVMRTRMQPLGEVFNKFNRIVRDFAKTLNKEFNLEISGSEVELDKSIIEALSDPLTHMVRNAVDHGIESPDVRRAVGKPAAGHIMLKAFHQSGHVVIEISDDGKGMNPAILRDIAVRKNLLTREAASALTDNEAYNLIFEPGFSTAEKVTDLSGRGVGMDVVRSSIKKLGGFIHITSQVGNGSCFSLRLPLTLAIVPALIVSVEELRFAIPQLNISEILWLHGADVYQKLEKVNEQEVFWLRGKLLPILRLSEVLGVNKTFRDPEINEPKPERRRQVPDRRLIAGNDISEKRSGPIERRNSIENSLFIVVLNLGSDRFGLIVDAIVDTEEIVVKPLHEQLKNCEAYAGNTVLGDGTIAMVLDISAIIQLKAMRFSQLESKRLGTNKPALPEDKQAVLLFSIGGSENFAIPLYLLSRVDQIRAESVQTANGREYLNLRGAIVPLLRVEKFMGTVNCKYADPFYVLIPRCSRPIAIPFAGLIDSIETTVSLDTAGANRKGIIGSSLINGRMTLFLDLFTMIETMEPGWFLDEGKRTRKRALLIEDSAFYQTLLSSFLKGAGVEVFQARNGQEGVDAMIQQEFDFVVSDINMPVMNGIQFAEWVRSRENLRHLPLLAISAEGITDDFRSQAIKAGFTDYKSKLDREGMIDAILNLCHTDTLSHRSAHV